MRGYRILLGLGLVSALPTPALACSPPPPPERLAGESDEDLTARARSFNEAESHEALRRQQSRWFDLAERVSLARITAAGPSNRLLGDSLIPAHRVEAVPLSSFKGKPSSGLIAMEDVAFTSCGVFGIGSARSGKIGTYVVTFEGVQPDGTGNVGILLTELREPRILAAFSEVAEAAQMRPQK